MTDAQYREALVRADAFGDWPATLADVPAVARFQCCKCGAPVVACRSCVKCHPEGWRDVEDR